MCTLIVAHQVVPGVPLLVVANRDEFLSRPSHPPAVRDRSPKVFCGLDGKDGGTWFGINAFGLVVGLTNLTLRLPDPSLRSRGLLCLDMLALRDVPQVRDALASIGPGTYNPFNLVAADGRSALRAVWDRAPCIELLGPGVHVTTNWPVGSPADAKRVAVQARLESLLEAPPEDLHDVLKQVARRHDGDGDPRVSVCCHAPGYGVDAGGYGTRASTVVSLDTFGHFRVEHADGPPCSADYADVSSQVREMVGAG